jgi:anti-anti-sigma regulatory factor
LFLSEGRFSCGSQQFGILKKGDPMPERVTSETAETARLSLAEAVTIRDMPLLHARLRDALAAHPTVTIDCTAVTDVDLTFLQLVLSARKSAGAAGKSVAIIPPKGEVLTDILMRAGLLCAVGDPHSEEQSFWRNMVADGGKDDSDGR